MVPFIIPMEGILHASHTAHTVRPDALFSAPVPPRRILVLDKSGNPLGLGHIKAEQRQGGHLMGYHVQLDDGQSLIIWPSQAGCPDNIVAPNLWHYPQGGIQ